MSERPPVPVPLDDLASAGAGSPGGQELFTAYAMVQSSREGDGQQNDRRTSERIKLKHQEQNDSKQRMRRVSEKRAVRLP